MACGSFTLRVLPVAMAASIASIGPGGLTARDSRARSRGVPPRIQPWRSLRLVLAGNPAWPMDAIDAAIATGKTRSVKLPHAIPVYLFYRTAWVDADGTVEFRNDVYGRDQRLNQALAQRDQKDQRAPDTRADAVPGKG